MHSQYPFPRDGHRWPITAPMVNALFGFPSGKKVPAYFAAVREFNGAFIQCLPSQPKRKHRMMTWCLICNKFLTVGCLNQHMNSHEDLGDDPLGDHHGKNT